LPGIVVPTSATDAILARHNGALVAEESERLEALVERVLAATRASERPHFAPVEPEELVRSAVALIRPSAAT
jgi:signal transduction histidine kinase